MVGGIGLLEASLLRGKKGRCSKKLDLPVLFWGAHKALGKRMWSLVFLKMFWKPPALAEKHDRDQNLYVLSTMNGHRSAGRNKHKNWGIGDAISNTTRAGMWWAVVREQKGGNVTCLCPEQLPQDVSHPRADRICQEPWITRSKHNEGLSDLRWCLVFFFGVSF